MTTKPLVETEGLTAEQRAIQVMQAHGASTGQPYFEAEKLLYQRIVKAIQSAERGAYERCAQIARDHVGAAGRKRKERGFRWAHLTDEAQAEITAEERGEDIAAEIIERNIRSLVKDATVGARPSVEQDAASGEGEG